MTTGLLLNLVLEKHQVKKAHHTLLWREVIGKCQKDEQMSRAYTTKILPSRQFPRFLLSFRE